MQVLLRVLAYLGIREGASVIIWAARLDFVVSAMAFVGAAVILLPVTYQLFAALARRRWADARRNAMYWALLVLLAIYCLASVINGLDTLDLIPE